LGSEGTWITAVLASPVYVSLEYVLNDFMGLLEAYTHETKNQTTFWVIFPGPLSPTSYL